MYYKYYHMTLQPCCLFIYSKLALITRPPDGVVLAPPALAAWRLRLRRLASLLEL